jgi:hypothetical protein
MTSPYAIVEGEAELGVQKRCPVCGDWWPAWDPEFWPRAGKQGFNAWCRDCKYQRRTRGHKAGWRARQAGAA